MLIYMEQDILKKLEELEKKVDEIYRSTRRTKQYIEWTVIIGIALVVLPLIGLAFVIPSFMKALSFSGLGGL